VRPGIAGPHLRQFAFATHTKPSPDDGFDSVRVIYRARAAFDSTRTRRRMATRTVAGGPSEASDHRINSRMGHRPRTGSRIKYQAAWIPSATAAAVGKSGRVVFPVVSRFARDHRLPYVSPSGDGSALHQQRREHGT